MSLDVLRQDLVQALRAQRRHPGHTAIIVATLGLGMAAATTVFSVLTPYLLRPLPFGDPGRLVQIGQVDPVNGWDNARLSLPQFEDWKQRSQAFEDLAAYHYGTRNLTGDGTPIRVHVATVTGDLFPLLRARPILGRTVLPRDEGPGGRDVVVLSHGLWQARFGGDSGVVGRTIRLDGRPYAVVGVMPSDFNFPWNEIHMWVPNRQDPRSVPRTATNEIPVGRLKPGWTRERARSELLGIQKDLSKLHPREDGTFAGVTVRPLREALNFAYAVVRAGLLLLLGAVGAVLLIACVNIASLMLARVTARSRDVAIRRALGASRGRMVRQFAAESLLLSLAGGGVGLALSYGAIRAIGPILPEALYRVGTARLDGTVLLFACGLTLLAPLVFGLTPAFGVGQGDLVRALREGGGAGTGRRSLRARRILVVAQVAMAVVLLVTAGLMLRSFMAVQDIDLGFRADRLLVVEASPPARSYPDGAAVESFYDRAVTSLASIPDVRSAGAVDPLPLNHETTNLQYAPRGGGHAGSKTWPVALDVEASAGYLDAAGIPLVAGRDFGPGDRGADPQPVIVSRTLAERRWPGERAVGKILRLVTEEGPVNAVVVGVAGDVRQAGLTGEARPLIYRPFGQGRRRFLVVSVRSGPPAALTDQVRRALARVDPDLPVSIRPMAAIVRENDFQWSVSSAALGAFGAAALLLAALGLYGVIAYSVVQRRRELGIRVALGATTGRVRRLVLEEGLRLTAVGLAIGVVLGLGAGRVLASQLYGVGPFDPVSVLAVMVLFAVVATAACARPASAAARTPPREVLRGD